MKKKKKKKDVEWWVWITSGFYSVTDIQKYVEYIIKIRKTLTGRTSHVLHSLLGAISTVFVVASIQVYINIINNRLIYTKKDGYKLELQASETMTLFSTTKKIKEKTKNKKI